MPRTLEFKRLLLLLAGSCQLLAACQSQQGAPPISPLLKQNHLYQQRNNDFISEPQPQAFSICYGHTCRYMTTTGLDADEWKQIRGVFAAVADAKTIQPETERELIGLAVARLETLVGAHTGTAGDRAGNFAGLGLEGQMDCVDEATNTSVYLTLLQNDGLLRQHRVLYKRSRGLTNLRGPHSTAMIQEIDSGEEYAVDSWFRDNGEPPYIIPYSRWYWGWTPPDW